MINPYVFKFKYYNLLNARFRQGKQHGLIRDVSLQNADKRISSALMLNKSVNSIITSDDIREEPAESENRNFDYIQPLQRKEIESKNYSSYLEPILSY